MKNKLVIGIIIVIQATGISAMDGCCDYKYLESIAKRYALSIENSGKLAAFLTAILSFYMLFSLKSSNSLLSTSKVSLW